MSTELDADSLYIATGSQWSFFITDDEGKATQHIWHVESLPSYSVEKYATVVLTNDEIALGNFTTLTKILGWAAPSSKDLEACLTARSTRKVTYEPDNSAYELSRTWIMMAINDFRKNGWLKISELAVQTIHSNIVEYVSWAGLERARLKDAQKYYRVKRESNQPPSLGAPPEFREFQDPFPDQGLSREDSW